MICSFCSRYLRLPIKEVEGEGVDSSTERHAAFDRLGKPKTKEDVIKMLGDQSGKVHTVFRENGGDQLVKTIAVGEIFKRYLTNIHDDSRFLQNDNQFIFFQEYLIAKKKPGHFIQTIQNTMNHLLSYHLY